MTFGAETKTRWLWFLTYIFLPINVIGQGVGLVQMLDSGLGGFGLIIILAVLSLAIATIIGLHQHKPWGWYCILIVFALQLIGTPFKVYQKESLNYEVMLVGNRYLESQGRSPIRNEKPSILDIKPVLTFFILMGIWTLPNAIYIYSRRSLFGLGNYPFRSSVAAKSESVSHSPMTTSLPEYATNIQDDEPDNAAYAQAWEEFESGSRDTGLWAKSFAESGGDEVQAKALYIKYRTRHIQNVKRGSEIERRQAYLNNLLSKAEAGDVKARQALCDIHNDPCVLSKYQQVDLELLDTSAQSGCSEALYILGRMYYAGTSVIKDDDRAFSYFSVAARRAHPVAMYNLACCYLNAIGTDRLDAQAAVWMMQSAEAGYPDAIYQVGLMYRNGIGFKKSKTQANEWFVKASGLGVREATAALSK